MEQRPTIAYRTCPLCEACCGLTLELENERVTRISGDPDDVFSRGFICPKGAALAELHHDPDRLRAPLVRRDGRLEEVDWPTAFAAVADGLGPIIAAHGKEALGIYLGNPNVHNLSALLYLAPLIKTLGSRHVYSASTVDQMPKHVSCGLLFGHPAAIPVPDLDRTRFLLIIGANPLVSNGSLCTAPDFPRRLREIRQRGGRVVVVDPRRTRTAEKADEHLFIRPGSDALWLLALVNGLLAEGLARPGTLAPQIEGLDELAPLVAPYTADTVASATGIDPAVTRRLTRELAASEAAAIYGRLGTTTVPFGTLTSWLVDVLHIVTGNLDRPGGAMFPTPAHRRHDPAREPGGRGFQTGRWHSRVRGWPEVRSELPVATLADEILTPGAGQLRGLIVAAGNPLLSTPNAGRLSQALEALDFMVSVDIYANETSRHADVILPPPSPLERSHYDLAFSELSVQNVANYSPPVLPKPAGQPGESEILQRLIAIVSGMPATTSPAMVDEAIAQRMVDAEVRHAESPIRGHDAAKILAALAPRTGPERLLDLMLRVGAYGDAFGARPGGLTLEALIAAPHGLDLGPLQPRIPEILRTPSGKIELLPAPIRAELERLGPPTEPAPGGSLRLIGRRHLRSNNSWMHNLPRLVGGRGRCDLLVHPADAALLGLSDGQLVELRSRVGAVRAAARLSEDLMPGVVCLPHGWGHDDPEARLAVASQHAGCNTNRLTDDAALDPLSGTAVLNGIPVTLTAISDSSPGAPNTGLALRGA